MTGEIRRVDFSDALFETMLAEAKAGDGRFLERLRQEWIEGRVRYDGPGECLLGALFENQLIAVGGVCADPYEPVAGLGRIRHVYVLRAHRGRGLGRKIVERLLRAATAQFDVLRLKTENPRAAALYESLGFERSEFGHETHRLELRGTPRA